MKKSLWRDRKPASISEDINSAMFCLATALDHPVRHPSAGQREAKRNHHNQTKTENKRLVNRPFQRESWLLFRQFRPGEFDALRFQGTTRFLRQLHPL